MPIFLLHRTMHILIRYRTCLAYNCFSYAKASDGHSKDFQYGQCYNEGMYNSNKGFIRFIIIIIVIILILSYFNFDLRGILEHPQVQKNFNYIWSFVTFAWDEYLARPVFYFWDKIVIGLFWNKILFPLF